MFSFFAALTVFFVLHILPGRPRVRSALVGALGERTYLAAFSIVSLLTLAWVLIAAFTAPFVPVWDPQIWHYWVPIILMVPASILLTAGLMAPNALSITLNTSDYVPDRPGIVALTRHPVLWGFGLWSGSHMVANGDVVSLILFGALTAFAILGVRILDKRNCRKLGDSVWEQLSRPTSIVPFAAVFAGRTPFPTDRRFLLSCALGTAIYILFLFGGHSWLLGPDPIGFL